MPLSATDAVSPAIEHTKKQLFQPFRWWQWTRLAFVGLLAGELGSGGGCNVPSNFSNPRQGGSDKFLDPALWHHNPALLAALITVAVVVGFLIMLVFMYINSRMRFVLFDSVIAKECHIREYWRRRREVGNRYFLWQALFGLAVLAGIVILLGVPAAIALAAGWWQKPSDHILPLILGGILVFLVFMVFLVCTAVVTVMTKDFVVPHMVVEDITAMEGWRRLWPRMKAEKGGYAGYIGMKIVLAIAAGIIFGIISLIVMLIIAVPLVIIGVIFGATAAGAGLSWNAATITLAVVAGVVGFALLLYVISLVSVPVAVFFPAYSIHFLASRYPGLDALLHPAPPTPPVPPETPPPMPPFLPPAPAPIG